MSLGQSVSTDNPVSPAQALAHWGKTAPFQQWVRAATAFWDDPKTSVADLAELGRLDRYFLLVFLLRRPDALHPFVYARCREVEADPDGYLDLWARYHYKSSIITFAGIIQEIINDPEIKIVIFSHTRPIAQKFLGVVKEEIETNGLLNKLYPDIFWRNPKKESPSWSMDGLTVQRKQNPKECTLEAYGLVNGMPTGGHWNLRIYDDVVTEDSVTNPEIIKKTTERLELSWNLGTHLDTDREQYAGTRYAFGDTYEEIEKRGVIKLRRYPATHNGLIDGKPVFLSPDKWNKIKEGTSIKTVASQQLLDPMQGGDQPFKVEDMRYYELRPLTLNVYILVDPARTKKKTSDRTAIAVVGIDHAWNRYLLDGLCHRLSLSERWSWIRHYRKKWMAARGIQFVKVGYEIYGSHADLEHFQEQMDVENDAFPIEELKWSRDAPDSFVDRVQRLEPLFRGHRIYFPYDELIPPNVYTERKMTPDDVHSRHKGWYFVKTRAQRQAEQGGAPEMVARPIIQVDEDRNTYNLVQWVTMNEIVYFPNKHVDFLDCLSRLADIGPTAPRHRSADSLTPPPEPDY